MENTALKKKKEIEEKVLSYVEKHRMLAAGDHVLCGLSGGADSVCLLYLLLAMKKYTKDKINMPKFGILISFRYCLFLYLKI